MFFSFISKNEIQSFHEIFFFRNFARNKETPYLYYNMITYPCAKINLGLNIVSKRADGYHNLETVFYPIPVTDILEVSEKTDADADSDDCSLSVDGAVIECEVSNNLVVKAYRLLAKDYKMPKVEIYLRKMIPMQAGLGGGSSDAAFMIRLLNKQFQLGMDSTTMEHYAARLGADCAFFIESKPCYATGIGEVLTPLSHFCPKENILEGWWIVLVKPDVAVSTKDAFSGIKPKAPAKCCRDIVMQPIETWKGELKNDFEDSIFPIHPELKEIKEQLYREGAVYAAMSGSGSTLFGLFREEPVITKDLFPNCRVFTIVL